MTVRYPSNSNEDYSIRNIEIGLFAIDSFIGPLQLGGIEYKKLIYYDNRIFSQIKRAVGDVYRTQKKS